MLTKDTREVYERIPVKVPGIYAFRTGAGRVRSTCYVGQSSDLRRRIEQHLEYRNSSVTTGVATISMNVEYITDVKCWSLPEFQDKDVRGAAELVAFEQLNPTLNSRGIVTGEAKSLASETAFRTRMLGLFDGPPQYAAKFHSVSDLHTRIIELEKQLEELRALVVVP